MPMGVVSDDEFFRELDRNKVRIPEVILTTEDGKPLRTGITGEGEVVISERPGRKEGDNNVPDSLRKIIGETSVLEGRQEALAIAKMFGISDSSVSAYAKGATSTSSYDKPKKTIQDYIRLRKDRVTKKALRIMVNSLDSIPVDLSNQKPKDVAAIAKDMAAIVKHLEPEQTGPKGDENNKFIFYSPTFVKEEHYDTIHVNE